MKPITFLLLILLSFAKANAREFGAFTLGGINTQQPCPAGFTCNNFTVTCPGIASITGTMADRKPTVPKVGLVVFFSGSEGTRFWSTGSAALTAPFLQSLLDQGYELVQIKWGGQGWLASAPGVQSGEEALACRPATVIQWVRDNLYTQGRFCLTGNSTGASQIAYVMSSYGTAADVLIPTSGPPMVAITKGCLNQPGYGYSSQGRLIDLSYGFRAPNWGPCVAHDPSFTDKWNANSVETGGTKYNYPATRVHIIVGGQDGALITNRANDYFQVLTQAKQPNLTLQIVPKMAHEIASSADGLAALFTALTK